MAQTSMTAGMSSNGADLPPDAAAPHSTGSGCVFCGALEPAAAAELVYADDLLGVVMDRFPVVEGHLLVFPRRHLADPLDLPTPEFLHLMSLVRRLGVAQRAAFEAQKSGLFTAGKEIGDHAHVHVLPLARGLKQIFAGLETQARPEADRGRLRLAWQRIEAHLSA